jgi:restriction endonuclease Mrr
MGTHQSTSALHQSIIDLITSKPGIDCDEITDTLNAAVARVNYRKVQYATYYMVRYGLIKECGVRGHKTYSPLDADSQEDTIEAVTPETDSVPVRQYLNRATASDFQNLPHFPSPFAWALAHNLGYSEAQNG